MVIFLVSAYVCYIKINQNIDNVKVNPGAAIFTFDTDASAMDINALDMLQSQNECIASSQIVLNALYTNTLDNNYEFNLVMINKSPYNKTPEVDGIATKEYTYEILKNNQVIVSEKQIESYPEDSKMILLSDKLESSNAPVIYEIIFRFYSNTYNQNHLVGTNLDSNLKVETLNKY